MSDDTPKNDELESQQPEVGDVPPRGQTEPVQHVDELGHVEETTDDGESEQLNMSYKQRESVLENKNFDEARSVKTPIDDATEDHVKEALHILLEHPQYAVEMLAQLRDADVTKDKMSYFGSIESSMRHMSTKEEVNPFNRSEAHWQQGLQQDNALINAGRVKLGAGNGKISGDAARLRLRAATGLGNIISIPLWHTGLWVKIKTPSVSTLIELERLIVQNKAAIGRSTSGVAFSNAAIYIVEPLINCIVRHIYDISYSGDKEPLDVIKTTDIPQLVWGFACTIYPDGFPFAQPCVANPRECTHVDYATLHVPKLSWLDNSSMSEYQRRIMIDRDSKISDDTLAEYARHHKAPQTRRVPVNENVELFLSVPTINQQLLSGNAWVDELTKMTNEAFGEELRGRQRDNYIIEQSQITQLRRYGHWVEKIVVNDDVISEREDIDTAISDLSADPDIRDLIVEQVEGLIRDCVVSAIGIPRYECPSCGGVASADASVSRLEEIIQLEVLEVFFTLEHTRVARAAKQGSKKATS